VLAGLGRQPSLDVWQSSREWRGTVAEAVEQLSLQVETHGAKPKPALIESIVASYVSLGQVRHSTLIEQGLLVWRVD
jgi:hypothetical protein